MRYKLIIVGALETNCYLVYCPDTKECAVVDPGAEPDKIYPVIAEEELQPVLLINTHGHVDHIGANRDIKDKYRVPLLIHAGDKDLLGKIQNLELSLFLGAQDSPPADRPDRRRRRDRDRQRQAPGPPHARPYARAASASSATASCSRATPCSSRASAGPICPAATRGSSRLASGTSS